MFLNSNYVMKNLDKYIEQLIEIKKIKGSFEIQKRGFWEKLYLENLNIEEMLDELESLCKDGYLSSATLEKIKSLPVEDFVWVYSQIEREVAKQRSSDPFFILCVLIIFIISLILFIWGFLSAFKPESVSQLEKALKPLQIIFEKYTNLVNKLLPDFLK